MSDFKAEVVKLNGIVKHPNADALSIVKVFDFPCIFKTGDFNEGDLAVYIPAEPIALVPVSVTEFSFLKGDENGKAKIKAIRLRGTFSLGLLIPAREGWVEGQDVTEILGVTRYEKPEQFTTGGENESPPGWLPTYTDIQSLRKYNKLFEVGEEVILTEKIHGANARFVYFQDRLWVGSHTNVKRQDSNNMWWKVATKLNLEEKLIKYQGLIIYGEVYGQVQNLKYDRKDVSLIIFDIYNIEASKYLNYDEAKRISKELELDFVPEIYRGPFTGLENLESYADGQSLIANNIREGFVIKPVVERWNEQVGRLVLKLHGQDFLIRKGKEAK